MESPRGATSRPRSASVPPGRAASGRAPRPAAARAGAPRARRSRRAPRRRGGAPGTPMSKRRASSCSSSSSASSGSASDAVARPRRRRASAMRSAAHVEVAGAVGAAEPLLARGGVEVAAELAARRPAPRRGPGRRRAAPARRWPPAPASTTRPVDPGDVRAGDQLRVAAPTAAAISANGHDADARCRGARARARQRREQARGAPRRWSAPRRRGRRSSAASTALTPSVVEPVSATSAGVAAHQRARPGARSWSSISRQQPSKEALPARPRSTCRASDAPRGLERRARHRAVGARVEVGEALEHRELGRAGRPRRADTRLRRRDDRRALHATTDWLSNTYLVGDEDGRHGVVIDSGGPPEPLLEAIERHELDVDAPAADPPPRRPRGREPRLQGAARRRDPRPPARGRAADGRGPHDRAGRGRSRSAGCTSSRCTRPGHTAGMLNVLRRTTTTVFTGDTLFKGSVGGVRAPGSTSFEDLQALDHGRADEAAAGDARASRPHRPDDGRRRVGEQRLRARLARARRGGRRALPCGRDEAHARALGARLRRRPQGLGALGPDGKDDIVPGSQSCGAKDYDV